MPCSGGRPDGGSKAATSRSINNRHCLGHRPMGERDLALLTLNLDLSVYLSPNVKRMAAGINGICPARGHLPVPRPDKKVA